MSKILVIEDDTLLGEEVIGVDGVEGVNLAFTHLPDVILYDIAMPRLDGRTIDWAAVNACAASAPTKGCAGLIDEAGPA